MCSVRAREVFPGRNDKIAFNRYYGCFAHPYHSLPFNMRICIACAASHVFKWLIYWLFLLMIRHRTCYFAAFLPSMVHRKTGRIVFVSSVAGKVPIPFRSSYAASKHALQAFADSLRAEVAMYNVKVLVSSPEYIAVDLSDQDVYRAGTQHEGKCDSFETNMSSVCYWDSLYRSLPFFLFVASQLLRRMHHHWAIHRNKSPTNCSCQCCATTKKIHRLPSNSPIGFASHARHSSIWWWHDVPNRRHLLPQPSHCRNVSNAMTSTSVNFM